MKYLIYKITNKLNGKIYVGQHATTNPNDSYMGSGKAIRRAIKRHGLNNFSKEIIAVFDNAEDMDELESFIVDEEFVNSPRNYNAILGGSKWVSDNLVVVVKDNATGALIQTNPVEARLLTRSSQYTRVESMTGRVVMMKDGNMRYIAPDEVDTMIAEGWVIEHPHKGTVTLYDPLNNKYHKVQECDVETRLGQGWIKQHTSKGRVRMYHPDTNDNRFVTEDMVEELLEKGYVKGNGFRKGRIPINNNGAVKYVQPDELDQWLSQGWLKGTGDKKLWMHNTDGKLIQVEPDEIEQYELDGWIRGSIKCGVKKGSVHIIKGDEIKCISKDELQLYLNDGWIKSGRPRRKGKWVNNGITSRLISDESEYNGLKQNGWVDGKKPINKGKIYVKRNEREEKLIHKSELAEYVKEGWIKGRTTRNRKK